MKVSNGALYSRLTEAITKTKVEFPDLNQKEIALALMLHLGEVLLNIDCPGCRRVHKKWIEEILPRILRDAMTEAARYPTQSSDHRH